MKNKSEKSHPAATGRFADYDEIASSFSYRIYNPRPSSKLISFINGIAPDSMWSLFSISVISIIFSVIIISTFGGTIPYFSAYAHFIIFVEYLALWVILFFLLVIVKNKIGGTNDIKAKGLKLSGHIDTKDMQKIEEAYGENKSFDLGILEGVGSKKEPSLLIGLNSKKRFEHTLIISPTGGGKTSRYIIPGICRDASYSNVSVFAIDIDSPNLYASVKKDWLKSGKTIIFFDPYGPEPHETGAADLQIRFNPLLNEDKEPLSDGKLFNLSSMLFHLDKREMKSGDIHAHKYYAKRSIDLFYWCLLYFKYRYDVKYFDLVTIKSFFERGVKFIEEEIINFRGENDKKIKILFRNFLELPVYERAKIVTDILNNLDFLNDENAAKRFRCKDKDNSKCFSVYDFFNKDTLFIVGIPKEKMNSGGDNLMSFITSIFINAIYEDRRKRLTSTVENKNNGDNNRLADECSIFMYLDEFPALSINNFDIELANLRKTNTGVCLTVQDISFLKDRYGDIPLITSNIGTHIVMGHAGYETCRYYSGISGERYIFHKESVRRNLSLPLSADFNETPVASGMFQLISPDELKNMSENSVFIYTKYLNPFILNLKPQYTSL